MSLRFLYLIFGRLLSWLVLPSREWSSNDGTELTDRILIFGNSICRPSYLGTAPATREGGQIDR